VKLLADEGVDSAIVTRPRSDGHDVVGVAELSPGITAGPCLSSPTPMSASS